jgi:NitT/TauT family transport system ATP-binding protein
MKAAPTLSPAAPVPKDAMVALQHVRKAFGSYRAVDDLSFHVSPGEIVAVLGRTGAGKTTVLNLVMGTTCPDSGSIQVAGIDPFRNFRQLRGRISVSFQTDRLLPWRKAVENVELGLLILGKSKAEARTNLSEMHARRCSRAAAPLRGP